MNVDIWKSIIHFLHRSSNEGCIIIKEPRWRIGQFNKNSIMFSVKGCCMVDCGHKPNIMWKITSSNTSGTERIFMQWTFEISLIKSKKVCSPVQIYWFFFTLFYHFVPNIKSLNKFTKHNFQSFSGYIAWEFS